jgi:hypothetical protein
MSALIKCPEGIELDLVMFLTSPSTGINIQLALRGLPAITPFSAEPDVEGLVRQYKLAKLAPDWRFMTRAEVAAYKAEEDED